MKKLDIEFVKNKIESYGCKLISNEYKNSNEQLNILFTCGHTGYRSYKNFLKKNKVCKSCSFKNAGLLHRVDTNDIKSIIELSGCDWVDAAVS